MKVSLLPYLVNTFVSLRFFNDISTGCYLFLLYWRSTTHRQANIFKSRKTHSQSTSHIFLRKPVGFGFYKQSCPWPCAEDSPRRSSHFSCWLPLVWDVVMATALLGLFATVLPCPLVLMATESDLEEASGFTSLTLPWAEASGLGWNICPGSHGDSMGSRLDPSLAHAGTRHFLLLSCCVFQFRPFLYPLPWAPVDEEALCTFAHLWLFIQLQDFIKSQIRKKLETIPYYSDLKVLVFSCGSSFIKGRKDHWEEWLELPSRLKYTIISLKLNYNF